MGIENEGEKPEGQEAENFKFPKEGNAEERQEELQEQESAHTDRSWYEALKVQYKEKPDEELLRYSTLKDADVEREDRIRDSVLIEMRKGLQKPNDDLKEKTGYSELEIASNPAVRDMVREVQLVESERKHKEWLRKFPKYVKKGDHETRWYDLYYIAESGDAPKKFIDAIFEHPDGRILDTAIEKNRVTPEQLGRYFSMIPEDTQEKVAPFWFEKQEALGMTEEEMEQALKIAQQKRQGMKKQTEQENSETGKEGA